MSTYGIGLTSLYEVECWHQIHEDGSHCFTPNLCPEAHQSVLRWSDGFTNLVTAEGLTKVLDATFKTGLASPAWYVGLVDADGFSTYDSADTLATHTGWAEFIDYTGNRQAFTPGVISAGSVTNALSRAVFDIGGTGTIQGAFLASAASGTSGTLYGEGSFAESPDVLSGDTLNITVTLACSSL